MGETATITIRRQILDVEVEGTEADGLALQRRLPGVCADVLAPALEEAFARIDPGDADLNVDHLAIELSGISLERFDAELADAVRREVADYFRRNPPVRPDEAGAPAAGAVQLRTEAETVDDALLVFLRSGRLPWSFRVSSDSQLEQLVLDTWGGGDASRAPPALQARLSETLSLPHARARLVMQFTPGFVATVLRGSSPQLAAAIEELLAAVDEAHAPSPAGAAFTRRMLDAALVAASADRRLGASDLARVAWRRSAPFAHEDRLLAAVLERHWPRITEHGDPQLGSGEVDAPRPTPSTPPVEVEVGSEGILVDNAGVALLCPFLPRFFEGLGIATVDQLLDPGRALCLIHHLATGELTAPEHHLSVAKVLCGVPLDEPVEADVGLTEGETEEAIALLDAAIRHWGALRDTSADALRVEFLMRPGVLAVDADGDWLLRVESRTVDVLLDQLPWGIAVVRLPWMARLLRVEWR